MSRTTLLLLSPSHRFGGGIERVADVAEDVWNGPVRRVDLYRKGIEAAMEGNARAKASFVGRVTRASLAGDVHSVLVLHAGLLPAGRIGARLSRAPLALFAHGVEVWGPMPPSVRRRVGRCDRLLANTEFTAQWLARRAGQDPSDVSVVPLPVDPGLLQRSQSPPGELRAPRLLTVSRLWPEHRYKGHFAIAEALPAVLERHPDLRWIVIGEGGDLPALRARCDALGLGEAVELLGRVSDAELASEYAQATAMVLPSVADPEAEPPMGEGFGLVYAEAAAYGVPSIASTAGGGCLDLVRNGETGLTVPPDDADALSTAILRLLEEPELRDDLARAARDRVLSRHVPEAFGRELRRALDHP